MISSRTPEGFPTRCAVCGNSDFIKPSTFFTRDAPCPHCGSLLWIETSPPEENTDTQAASAFETAEIDGVTIVRLLQQKILDEQAQSFGESLFDLIDTQGKTKILLSFRNVEFISSAALGILITLNKVAQQSGGKLVLCGIRKDVLEVFTITKLHHLFNIVDG